MTSDLSHRSLLNSISGKRLIVVSNREPYVHKRSGLRIMVETPVSGLTSALDDVLKDTQGTRVASENDISDSIGSNSKSDYYLRDQEKVSAFLDYVTEIMSQRREKVNEAAHRSFLTADYYDSCAYAAGCYLLTRKRSS